MITEKAFVLRHNAFWHRLLPMAPAYVRTMNVSATEFARPVSAATDDNRGVVNELAFRLFAAALLQRCAPGELDATSVQAHLQESLKFIQRFREYNRQPVGAPSEMAIAEAVQVAENIGQYFAAQHTEVPLVWPKFAGCGVVDECSGDAIADEALVEVKSGGGPFRGRDVRQVLCYAALNFANKRWDLRRFCLVNPRRGVFFGEDVDKLCRETAGASAVEVLSDIVQYVSEPFADADVP